MNNTTTVVAVMVDATQVYQVRTSCGHLVERRMRPSTAGVPVGTVVEAPHGRACAPCEAAREAERVEAEKTARAALEARGAACKGHERDVEAGTLLCKHCGCSMAAAFYTARALEEKAARKAARAAKRKG